MSCAKHSNGLKGRSMESLRIHERLQAAKLWPLSASVLLLLPVLAVPAARAQTLSLSPAIIMASGTYGQSLTQQLTISNQSSQVLDFKMVAEDVVVRNGKRVFLPAGEAPNSIAATAVFAPQEVVAPPHTSQSATVTITIPPKTDIRAIVAVFQSLHAVHPTSGSVGLVASMGTLITFNLGNDVAITADPVQVTLPTSTTNLAFLQNLTNTGGEPVIPKGVAAILNSDNHLVGKVSFVQQRLLPGEKLPFHAEFADQLQPGKYHVLCTFTYEGHSETQQADFAIP